MPRNCVQRCGLCESGSMLRRPFRQHCNDSSVYLVVNDFGQFGRAFVETDVAAADRETIIRNFITGQYSDAIRVVAAQSAVGRPCTNFDGKSNPFGRPRGLRNRATVAAEAMLDGEAQELTRKVIELGKSGNLAALRLCIDQSCRQRFLELCAQYGWEAGAGHLRSRMVPLSQSKPDDLLAPSCAP